MLKTILVILVSIAILQPAAASDSLIFIRPGTLENQTKGFVLMYPLENTVEPGQTIIFRNEDLHRRPFTLVSEEDLFYPALLSFRMSLSVQFDEPGTYNFYLEEKPTVTVQLTVIDNDPDVEPQATRSPPQQQHVVAEQYKWGDMENIPGFCVTVTLIMLISALLLERKKE